MAFPDFCSLDDALERKISALRQVCDLSQWRFHAGNPPGASEPDFADDAWPQVHLPHTWSSAASDVWFRRTVVPPAASEGLSLAGSGLEMIVFLAIGATVYIDGRRAYYDRWWADSQGTPLLLSERAQPGVPIALAVHVAQGDGFGLFAHASLRYSQLAEGLFDLELFRRQMAFTRHLLERDGGRDPRLERAWQEALASVAPEDLAANRWSAWQAGVARARAALAPFAAAAKEYTTYFVGHAHIDMNWLWTLAETVAVCRRDFAAADQLMTRYPEFVFSQSQAATYRLMEEQEPALFARIQERVRQGRWDVTANTWVEGDLNMAGGEAIARHILLTQRYVKSRFGRQSLICWEPDTFGHPATMPQILAKSGIKYYYCCRAGKGHPVFWWESPDGSRVLAVVDPLGYNGQITPQSLVEPAIDLERRLGLKAGLYVYGVGDHGGGATARDIEAARALDQAPYLPHARLSDTLTFYRRVEQEAGAALPVIRDELNPVFEGCYTTHGDIKWLNRRGESDLLTAETLATLGALRGCYRYPRAELGEAWQLLLFHQFHDILCGAGIGATYREARERLAPVAATTTTVADAALAALAAQVDTGGGPEPRLVVSNPLVWERTDVVRVPLAALSRPLPTVVEDAAGRRAPTQVVGDELLFVAEQVPALGCQVYRLLAAPWQPSPGDVAAPDDLSLENGILRLHLHPDSGAIDSLWDKECSRDVAESRAGWGPERRVRAGYLNRLEVQYEQPHTMSAWNLGEITRVDHLIVGAGIRVLARGPVCGILEVSRRFLRSALVQRIVLYRGMRRIDIETELDWHEQGTAVDDAPMLRATFTPFLRNAQATFEVPFAALARPADGREMPTQRWADLSDEGYGLSLLNNGKYGYSAHYHTLGLTLVRSPYEPDGQPDQGLHRFTYSLYPHPGTWREAASLQRAAELNQPLLVRPEPAHGGALAPGQPMLVCEPGGVVVSALKLAEDQPGEGTDLIVRLYETHGRPATASLTFGFAIEGAEETDLVENPLRPLALNGARLSLPLGPYEIKTVRLHRSL